MKKTYDNLSVAIIAGGKSTRMGQNKALMILNNQTIIEKISNELSEMGSLTISAASSGLYEEYCNRIVYDENKDIGPIEGIRQVLIHAETEYVFVCAADMPFINKDLVKYMAEFISSDYDCYVLEDGEKLQPLCAIYSKKLLPIIEELIKKGQYKLLGIIKNARTKYISLEYSKFDKNVVRNINTKRDFFDIVKPCVFAVSGLKNSGKTGLIEKLINEFINEGYSVATLKHDGCDVLMDAENTDSYRFFKSGAIASAVCTDSRYMINVREKKTVDELVNDIKSIKNKPDFIILEGFKKSDYPKVEIVRKGVSDKSICDNLICIATDLEILESKETIKVRLDDISEIFFNVKKYFGLT